MSEIRSIMYIGRHVKHPFFFSDFNETRIFSTNFYRCSNVKLHENPSSGSQVAPCGQTDMTKLIVAFRNFSNAPRISANPSGIVGLIVTSPKFSSY